eukprot:6461427-Amphidinium_carterae.3
MVELGLSPVCRKGGYHRWRLVSVLRSIWWMCKRVMKGSARLRQSELRLKRVLYAHQTSLYKRSLAS